MSNKLTRCPTKYLLGGKLVQCPNKGIWINERYESPLCDRHKQAFNIFTESPWENVGGDEQQIQSKDK